MTAAATTRCCGGGRAPANRSRHRRLPGSAARAAKASKRAKLADAAAAVVVPASDVHPGSIVRLPGGARRRAFAAAFAPMPAHRTTPTHLVLVSLASIAVARRSDAIQRPVESRADHNGAGTFAPSRTPLALRPGDDDRCRPESNAGAPPIIAHVAVHASRIAMLIDNAI